MHSHSSTVGVDSTCLPCLRGTLASRVGHLTKACGTEGRKDDKAGTITRCKFQRGILELSLVVGKRDAYYNEGHTG